MNFPEKYTVPWSARGVRYTDDEIAAVVEVMKNSDILTQGEYQKKFEQALNSYLGESTTFALATGTAALELAAILSDLEQGDEVILPAHTFVASAIPFARSGAKLVWADINPETFLISAETIAPLITDKTRVIIVVHLYGLIAEMEPIVKLAEKHNLILIEDTAQALGARIGDKMAGTFGDFGCFSFHSHKNITTLGEGGAIWIKQPLLAKKIPGLRHNGLRSFPEPREKYWIPAMSNVDFDIKDVWPYNFCISEAQCALGIKLLARLDLINSERAARYERIVNALTEYPELQFQRIKDRTHSAYHLLPARITSQYFKRDDLIELLAKKYKIKCVVQYCPLYRYPIFINAGLNHADCPETDLFFDNMISIPFQHWMSEQQEEYLINSFKEAIDSFRRFSSNSSVINS